MSDADAVSYRNDIRRSGTGRRLVDVGDGSVKLRRRERGHRDVDARHMGGGFRARLRDRCIGVLL